MGLPVTNRSKKGVDNDMWYSIHNTGACIKEYLTTSPSMAFLAKWPLSSFEKFTNQNLLIYHHT